MSPSTSWPLCRCKHMKRAHKLKVKEQGHVGACARPKCKCLVYEPQEPRNSTERNTLDVAQYPTWKQWKYGEDTQTVDSTQKIEGGGPAEYTVGLVFS